MGTRVPPRTGRAGLPDRSPLQASPRMHWIRSPALPSGPLRVPFVRRGALRALGVSLFTVESGGPDYDLSGLRDWIAWRDGASS